MHRNIKYIKIADKIKEELLVNKNHSYPLESERQLAEKYNVSRDTIRKALSLLYAQNIIHTKNRSGSFSLPSVINRNLHNIHTISEDIDPLKLAHSIDIISISTIDKLPDVFVDACNDTKFHKIKRRILINNIPIIYEEHYLPTNLFPEFTDSDAKAIIPFVETYFKIKDSYQNISIKPSQKNVLNALEINTPFILYVHSQSFLEDGRIFQLTEQFFHPNYNFKLHLERK